jgi:hypothetical protein
MTPTYTSRIARLAVAGLAAGALAAPTAAVARPATDAGATGDTNASAVGAGAATETDSAPYQSPVVEQIDTGIDWGSAALGAGVGGVVILLSSAGVITYRRRHPHEMPVAH